MASAVGFPALVHRLSGHAVIAIDPRHPLIDTLEKGLNGMLSRARYTRYHGGRVNEVGRSLEAEIRGIIESSGVASIERQRQAAGYPDMSLRARDGTRCYLEIKTTTESANRPSTLRAFYISSGNKITSDAHHLLVHLYVTQIPTVGKKSEFQLNGWVIKDLHGLALRPKLEYNASHADMSALSTLASS